MNIEGYVEYIEGTFTDHMNSLRCCRDVAQVSDWQNSLCEKVMAWKIMADGQMPNRILTQARSLQADLDNTKARLTSDKEHLAEQKSAYETLQSKFADGLQSHFQEMNNQMTSKID